MRGESLTLLGAHEGQVADPVIEALEWIIETSKDGPPLTAKADINLRHQLRSDHQAEPDPRDGLDMLRAQLGPSMKDLAGFDEEGELKLRAYLFIREGKRS